MAALLAFLVVVFAWSMAIRLPVLERWTERPLLFICPLVGLVAFAALAEGLRRGTTASSS